MKEPKTYCTCFVISKGSCNFLNTKVNKETNIISQQHKMQINVDQYISYEKYNLFTNAAFKRANYSVQY